MRTKGLRTQRGILCMTRPLGIRSDRSKHQPTEQTPKATQGTKPTLPSDKPEPSEASAMDHQAGFTSGR